MKQVLRDEVRRLIASPGARAFLQANVVLDPDAWRWPVIADVTYGCNLRCRFCDVSPVRPERVAGSDLFLALAEEVLPHASEVAFGCRHEPLLHPDLPDRLRDLALARDRAGSDAALCLLTSGTLLDNALSARLASSGLDVVLFSVDTTHPDLYERLRPPATWPETRERIAAFTDAARGGRPKVAAQALILRSTLPHIASTMADLAAVGVRRFHASQAVAGRLVDGEIVVFDGPDRGRILAATAALSAEASRLGVEARTPGPPPDPIPGEVMPVLGEGDFWDEHLWKRRGPAVCALPWCKVRVDDRGDVFPCFRMLDADLAWGNVLRSRFEDIVNGPVAIRTRRALLEGSAPNAACATCPFGPDGGISRA